MSEREAEERVARVVRGGATMSPMETPRPEMPPFLPVLRTFLVESIRGPLLAALFCKLTFPTYSKYTRQRFGGDEQSAFVFSTSAVHTTIYLAMFTFFELFGKTEWLHQYQLPRTPAQEPTWKMKSRVLLEFALNSVLNYLLLQPIAYWFLTQYRGMPSVYSKLPSLWKTYLQFLFCYQFNQFGFAAAHRVFHHGPLYRRFHKKHHEFVGTVTIAAENAHPLEHAIANVATTVGGSFLLGSHPYIFLTWLAWRLEQTLEAHSGYCFYGSWLHKIGLTHSESTAFHDFHHTENKGAFGTEFTDYLFGTLDSWIKVGRTEGYVKKAKEQHDRERLLI